MSAPPDAVAKLVEKFEMHRDQCFSSAYREEELRGEFIDPFFEALGWDVTNRARRAEAYKDLVREGMMKAGAPDYLFRVGGTPKFYVEAKKPSVRLAEDPDPALQLRGYLWTANLHLGIVTDFEEFAVYDGRIDPKEKDGPGVAQRLYLTYRQYADRWDDIASVFSKEAVEQGRFDAYAGSEKIRGFVTVDQKFLKDIESWRDTLAHNIANRNGRLTDQELNGAVQSTIDRILFLRMAEDRGIEPFGRLQALANGTEIYARLREIYRDADNRYNSGLFHFTAEKDRHTPPDTLTPRLDIDDKVLKDIVQSLYFPRGHYKFSVLPPDILGSVYEQFLGKVIRLTPGGQARVEEKPEVKKAGGVYYTPKYIVDYIVEQTVGRLVADKTPKQIAKMRVLDPACGSGSFLVGAYRWLLGWHLDEYVKDGPENHPKEIVKGPDGWLLRTAEKKRILIKNIFGVDIDRQAVEVTKLNLLLCVLENEKRDDLDALLFQHERALPDLDSNIKCGNSLIGPDYFTGQLLPDEDELRRVNPFDWKAEFPQVFPSPSGRGKGEGGFDCVIGNPPYIRIQTMKEWAPLEVEIYKQLYASAATGNYDIYVVFVEKGLSLLRKGGRLGFILPHKFFNAQYGQGLRSILSKGKHLSHVVHFGAEQVFDGATTYTCLMFLEKTACEACQVVRVDDIDAWKRGGTAKSSCVPFAQIGTGEWNLLSPVHQIIKQKLELAGPKLAVFAKRIFQGLKTGGDTVFILESLGKGKFFSKCLEKEVCLEPAFIKPLFKSGDFKRYCLIKNSRVIIFPYENGRLVAWREIEKGAPKTARYLDECRKILADREGGIWKGTDWYCFTRNQALDVVSSPKILTADLNPHANYCLDEDGDVFFTGGAAGGYGVVVTPEQRHYLLGLLNSRLLDWYLKQISTRFRGGWFSYESRFIEQLPVRPINLAVPADKSANEKMVKLVDAMLELHKRLAKARSDADRALVQRQIDATDREIDSLVYALYGLTKEEIRIVEESAT